MKRHTYSTMDTLQFLLDIYKYSHILIHQKFESGHQIHTHTHTHTHIYIYIYIVISENKDRYLLLVT